MPEAVSEDEALLFAALLNTVMEKWKARTGRDEIPSDLARKVLRRMDEREPIGPEVVTEEELERRIEDGELEPAEEEDADA